MDSIPGVIMSTVLIHFYLKLSQFDKPDLTKNIVLYRDF